MAEATETTEEVSRDDQLDALIRLIAPARALKEELEKRLHLELHSGTGDFAIKNFRALQASVAKVADDPYLATMTLETPENAGDKEKVSLAALAASQLLAYLMGQTGVAAAGADLGGGGGSGNHNINYSTGNITVTFSAIEGVTPETLSKMSELGSQAIEAGERIKAAEGASKP